MTDGIVPKITIPVDPASVVQLDRSPLRLGGVRQRVTLYAVVEADLAGPQRIAVLTAPMHANVEVRIVE